MSGGNAVEVIKEKIDSVLLKYPVIDEPLTQLSEKCKVEKAYLAAGIGAAPLLILLFFGVGHFLIDIVGFVYPMYRSLMAIESYKTVDNKEDVTEWLTYWLIFGMFKIVEGIVDAVLGFNLIYFAVKAMFLVWCMYPATQGAKVIYATVITPFVVPHICGSKTD